MGRFDGKVVLITGAARGQGREHAVRLASEGARLLLLDLCAPVESTTYEPATVDDLDESVRLVEKSGGQVIARRGDVRSAVDVSSLVGDGVDAFGRLDGVIANAAICSYGRLWELTDAQWHETVDVNLTGVWQTVRAVVPAMIDADNGGSIVITSSGAGLKGIPMLGHYGATKWAVVGMARTLANEVAAHRIRVNTIHPTAVRTPMGDDPGLRSAFDAHPEYGRSFGNMLPVGKIDASDIADAVLWLLSDEARWVTGVALPVDAGASQV